MEAEPDESLDQAMEYLVEKEIAIDLSDLPRPALDGASANRLRREAQLVQEGTLLTALDDTDPLRLYLEEIAAIPAFGDLRLLAEELAEANRDEREEPELWTQILNLCLSRVYEMACRHTGLGVLMLDLMQEGSMGLWSALPCYDGGDIDAFRDWHIRQAMAQAITLQAFSNGMGQKMRQAMEDYRAVDERLLAELGRNPTVAEIAEQLHMTVEETAVVSSMLESARSMNRARAETEEKEPEPDDQQAVEDTAYFQMRQRIEELLSGLDEREAKLLTLRFGLEGGVPLSPEAAGKQLGMTAEEVVAAEAAALGKLRKEG
jgi:RNA polymerase primary sigma factor